MKYAGVLSAAVATLVVMKYFVMMFGFAGMLCAYQTAPAQDAARILHVDTGFAQNIYKMVTVTDRHGKTKTKKQHTVEEVYVDIPEQHGVIVDARDVSQYAGSNTQYSSPSQACLNNLLCHVISGDPTSSTQAVYQNLAVFTIHTGNLTYVAYDKGRNHRHRDQWRSLLRDSQQRDLSERLAGTHHLPDDSRSGRDDTYQPDHIGTGKRRSVESAV